MSELSCYGDVSHPFGDENQVSLEYLFKSFCNNVTLGQWELARVCLRNLYKKRQQLGEPFKEFLRALIDQPLACCNGSPTVTSPFHLSWLCLVEYLDLFTSEEDKLPEPVSQTVKFRLLLYLTCKNAPKQVIQELDNYHSELVYDDPAPLSSQLPGLPSTTLNYIKQLLDDNPDFGHELITELTGKGRAFLENNQLLQTLYAHCIDQHLKAIDIGPSSSSESISSSAAPEEFHNDVEPKAIFYEREQQCIYKILSLINPTSEMIELAEILDLLFQNLINRIKLSGPQCLDRGRLYSCLFGRPTTFLVRKFCDIENRMRFQFDRQLSLPSSQGRYGLWSLVTSPTLQVCYSQSFVTNRRDAWQQLFFHSMGPNHVLENIVETALLFVKDGDFDKVTQLLSPVEFRMLKPLVLLLGWPYCYSCENARTLLDALWEPKSQVTHPVLYQACQKLAYQVQLVQWCLDKARPLLASTDSGSTHHQQASEMFQGLKSHSVLHVLHKSISLAHLPEKEVFSLLRKRPVFSPSTFTSDTRETSIEKELPFDDEQIDTQIALTEEIVEDSEQQVCEVVLSDSEIQANVIIHPEVDRDVVLYHSFCALRNFMESITTVDSRNPDKKEEEEFHDETSKRKDSRYDMFLKKLQEGKMHLSYVYPLTYRVEVLENIFSLLFATYEDLYEETTRHDSDGFETADEETKSLNTSLTGSMESLLSSASTDVTGMERSGQFSPLTLDRISYLPQSLTSTSESSALSKDPSTECSRGSKRQLFQRNRLDSDPTSFDGDKRATGDLQGTLPERIRKTLGVQTFADGSSALDVPKGTSSRRGTSPRTCCDQDQSEGEPKIGFVASDEIVIGFLKTVKEALMELNAAKLNESRRDTPDIRNRPDWLRTSVPSGTLEQRVSRLGQYIVEAQWRYQLVSWTDPARDERGDKTRRKSRKYRQVSGGRGWVIREAEEGSDEEEKENTASAKQPVKENGQEQPTEPRSGESSPYLSQELTTGTEDNFDTARVRRKRPRKAERTSRASVSEGLVIRDSSIVARMLSSPDTLIYMCMRKDSYDRAYQVIKMFQLQSKPSAQAAVFAEKFTNAFKQLTSLQPRPRRQNSHQGSTSLRNLGAVAKAAASGVTTSVVSNVIDELLTSPKLPVILLPNVDCQELMGSKSHMGKFLAPGLVPVMVCLDLACTTNVSWEVCNSLLDTAMSRLTPEDGSPVKLDGSLVGVVDLLADIRQLLASSSSDDTQQNRTSLFQPSKPNAVDILLCGTQPIKQKARELTRKLVQEQEESLKRSEQALEDGDTAIISVDDSASQTRDPARKPGKLGSRSSFHLIQKSVAVRVALTELQKSFDCVELVDHMVISEGGGVKDRLDYLRSIINYVDTLATLLLHWQAKPAETSSGGQSESLEKPRGVLLKASNPFVVLNEGITETLGRPMFEKNVSPERLENVSKQLHVNLVKVIVHNCCPYIPSSNITNTNVLQWSSSVPVILNSGGQWQGKAREPNIVAKELLTKMIDLLKGVAQSNDGFVNFRSAATAVRTPEFHMIAHGAEELQKVDLDLLHTNTTKVCFFTNVLNLLLAHASLIQFSTGEDEEEWEPKLARRGSLGRLGTSVMCGVEGEHLARSSLERIAFLKQHCYALGQLGATSAFDILYVILHTGLMPPSTFGLALQLCYPERPADDPKRKYKPTMAEKRIVFAICDGCVSSPKLQVLDTEELDTQLIMAVEAYVNSFITINVSLGQVVLPELLRWYKKDFERSPLTDTETLVGDTIPDPDVSLLLQLELYLNPDLAASLHTVLPNIKEITFTPFCWRFGYIFDVPHIEASSSSASFQRSTSMSDSLQLSMEFTNSTASTKSLESRGKYPLNKSTLAYLEKTSPLVAALVGLMCSSKHEARPSRSSSLEKIDPNEAVGSLNEDDKKSKPSEPSQLPFRGALERTSKFPTLQRYLVARFYSLSEFLTLTPVDQDKTQFSGSYEIVKLDSKQMGVEESPEISLFPLVLSAEGSHDFQLAFLKVSDYYLRRGNFELLLELLRSSGLHGDGSASRPVDFLLTSAILSKGGTATDYARVLEETLEELKLQPIGYTHKWQNKPWSLLAQVQNNEHLARLVLSKLREWRARDGMDLLDLCLCRSTKSCALRTELKRRKHELSLYIKITRCAKAPQLRCTYPDGRPRSTSLLTQWQGVAAASLENPELIKEFLLSLQQYELAADWAELHALSNDYYKTIKEDHLKYLLESSPEDTMKAYRILEGIQEQQMALSICESLLQQNLHVSQTLFIIQFMLTNLHPHLSPLRIEKLLLTKMGAKALLCLPEDAKPSYEHLVSRPSLLLEQLLMNLKVDWAARVFSRLQVDLASMEDTEGARDHGCTVKAFDDLLAKYAFKALEFKVVQPDTNQDVPSGLRYGFAQTPSSSSPTLSTSSFGGRITPIPSSGRQTPSTSTPIKDRGDQDSTAGSPDLKRKIPPGRGPGSLGRSISTVSADNARRVSQQSYVPPAIPPRKQEWIPDAQVMACVICNEAFSMFNRRHHCRRCGRVVCGTCSTHNCIVQGYGKTLVRVCSNCYDRFYAAKSHGEATEAGESSPVYAAKGSAHPGSLERSVAQESLASSYNTNVYMAELEADNTRAEFQWKLTLDAEFNASVRDEFYYEQAPSSSLCTAILDLHSDDSACGRLILGLCNTLSKILVPLTPGVRNEELDHNLIISMIRYLLFNAKLKMMKAGETQGVELCDTYLGHVELMKFLVESNCGDIPSLQDLMHPESARRFRDRFIEDERLSLAMEVSTKCGLDPSGVWAAAGFAFLRAGNFAAAREKFARCIKPVEEVKHKQQQSSQYLDKVLDIIQTSPLISFPQATDALLSPLHGLAEHCKTVGPGGFLDSKRFEECLHYLHTYGSPASVVGFYVRHGQIKQACKYLLDKKCAPDVFVESLLMRLVSKGNLSALKDQMENIDPSLQAWMPYLTAACRYLHKRGYHYLLYDLQLFMKDFFRAAQTCIRFFEGAAGGPVTSYEDLYSRLDYLGKARAHIEAVIMEKRSPRGSVLIAGAALRLRNHGSMRSRSSDDLSHVALTLSDLNNHVNSINLQVEVTNFMHRSAVDGVSILRANDDGRLPTLFGNGHIRGEVATQVLLAGSAVQDGFTLASRIIQDYNLPASRVYIDTGRALARQYRYTHIQQLLRCVGDTGLVSDRCHDDIILACVLIVSSDSSQAKHVDSLIRVLRSDTNKINAFLLCGKLRSAYLIAVKEKRVEAIQEIAEAALKADQTKTVELCKKWLAQNQKLQEAQQRPQRRQEPKR